jgi:carboxylate-amine ligase
MGKWSTAHWFSENTNSIRGFDPPPQWRAMRFGLDAEMIVSVDGCVMPVHEVIAGWIDRISGITNMLGYDSHIDTLKQILASGNSSMRQRAVLAQSGSMRQVVQCNVGEHKARYPKWDL